MKHAIGAMKLAVVTHAFPPEISGQAQVLSRLLQNWDPDRYCVLSQQAAPTGTLRPLTLPFQFTRGCRWGLAAMRQEINTAIGWTYYLPALKQEIAQIATDEQCTVIVACTGNLWNLPASFAASRSLGIPLIIYVFDDYAHQRLDGMLAHTLACRWERTILTNADSVIVTNEVMADVLRQRYGIVPIVLYNPCDLSYYEQDLPSARQDDEVRIVYTGSVYAAQADALTNLCVALDQLADPRIALHIYSPIERRLVEESGIHGRVVFHGSLPAAQIPMVQRQADILFLPLAFNSPFHPLLINTSMPGKFPECLAARRPVLVHAPAESVPALYCRQHGCGLVVDECDPGQLAAAIQRLIGDRLLRQQLTDSAWACVRSDFDLSEIGQRFERLLSSVSEKNRQVRQVNREP